MDKEAKLKNLLRDRSLKATPKRLEVLRVIRDYKSAIPYGELQKKLKHFDRVTLYRALIALLESGIIHKASVSTDEVYYAMCKEKQCTSESHNHEHVHFKCSECLQVSCVELSNSIEVKIPNVTINQVEIEVSGICEKCR